MYISYNISFSTPKFDYPFVLELHRNLPNKSRIKRLWFCKFIDGKEQYFDSGRVILHIACRDGSDPSWIWLEEHLAKHGYRIVFESVLGAPKTDLRAARGWQYEPEDFEKARFFRVGASDQDDRGRDEQGRIKVSTYRLEKECLSLSCPSIFSTRTVVIRNLLREVIDTFNGGGVMYTPVRYATKDKPLPYWEMSNDNLFCPVDSDILQLLDKDGNELPADTWEGRVSRCHHRDRPEVGSLRDIYKRSEVDQMNPAKAYLARCNGGGVYSREIIEECCKRESISLADMYKYYFLRPCGETD